MGCFLQSRAVISDRQTPVVAWPIVRMASYSEFKSDSTNTMGILESLVYDLRNRLLQSYNRGNTRQLYLGKYGVFLGKLYFPVQSILPGEKLPRLIFVLKWLKTMKNAPRKTLDGLKDSSVSPGKPTNEKQSFGHCSCSAWYDQLNDLICKQCLPVKDWAMLWVLNFNRMLRLTIARFILCVSKIFYVSENATDQGYCMLSIGVV